MSDAYRFTVIRPGPWTVEGTIDIDPDYIAVTETEPGCAGRFNRITLWNGRELIVDPTASWPAPSPFSQPRQDPTNG